jgi:hypothetical protein
LETSSASNPSVRDQIAAIREQIPELLRSETAPLEEKLSRLSTDHDRRMQEQEKKLDKLQQMLSEYAAMTSTLTNKMDNLGMNIISVYKSIQHNGHGENSHPNDRGTVGNGSSGTFLNGHCLDDERGDLDDLDEDYHGGRRERDRIDSQTNGTRVERAEAALSPESGAGISVGKGAGSSGRRSRGSAKQ